MQTDLVLVGGGLANGLLARRLAQLRPDISVLVLESGPTAGGNHTWSFHAGDLTPSEAAWIEAFVVYRWPAYDVAFPGYARRVELEYRSVTSERFAAVMSDTLGSRLRCRAEAVQVSPRHVLLAGGERVDAAAVIDGRGATPTAALDLAYQKFLGLEVRLDTPHGLERPILMDATVEQVDGYRFVYVLPLAPDRLLIEDTYYADDATLGVAALKARIEAYAAGRGWRIRDVLRTETGVLPITLSGDIRAFWREGTADLPRTGLRAALFHPTTGYSLPDAVRLADHVAGLADLSAESVSEAIQAWSIRRWQAQRFFRQLNRMLFRAGPASQRFRVLQRFYGLPEPTIRRFYAGALSPLDRFRLLAGKPPVPVVAALRALMSETRVQRS
jgi:lycopene beta-cyclase